MQLGVAERPAQQLQVPGGVDGAQMRQQVPGGGRAVGAELPDGGGPFLALGAGARDPGVVLPVRVQGGAVAADDGELAPTPRGSKETRSKPWRSGS